MDIVGISIETLSIIVLFVFIAGAILYRAITGSRSGSSSADMEFGRSSDGDGGDGGGGGDGGD